MDEYMHFLVGARIRATDPTAPVYPRYKVSKAVSEDPLLPAHTTYRVLDLPGVHASYNRFAQLELGRAIKEAVCRVSDGPLAETSPRLTGLPTTLYELPDGRAVDVGMERYAVPELLFDPSSLPAELHASCFGVDDVSAAPSSSSVLKSVPRLLLDSVALCEGDTQAQAALLAGVVVTGGGAMWEGLPERIRLEVRSN